MTATDAQPMITYRRAEVRASHRPTRRTVRITLGGDDLAGLPPASPDGYMKLFFPLPGQSDPQLPAPDADGDVRAWFLRYRAMPDGTRPPMRTYTVRARREDPDTGAVEIDVDFVAHEQGPAWDWAVAASPGDRIAFIGPYPIYAPRPEHDWVLMVGDETAVPAMCAIAEDAAAAGRRVVGLAEVHDEGEHRDWGRLEGVSATWLSTPSTDPSRLCDVLRHLSDDLPSGRPYVWLSGEASTVKALRRHVVGTLGVPKGDVCFTGYWRRGVTEDQAVDAALAAQARGEDPTDL